MKYVIGLISLFACSSASAQDWKPSQTQTENLRLTAQDFFHALDAQKYEAAYKIMAPSLTANMSFEQFLSQSKSTELEFGQTSTRLVQNVWWYPGAAEAGTGLAAAIDFHGSLRNEKKFCGYIALVELEEATFAVMRNETTLVDLVLIEKMPVAQKLEFLDRPGCRHFLQQ